VPNTRIKICGITTIDDALAAAEAGADALGFMFYRGSRRCIPVELAANICRRIPPFLTTVGVFVDPSETEVRAAIEACGLSAVQLHGDETPEFCSRFNVPVIKAFRIRDRASLESLRMFSTHAWLLDAYAEGSLGGTGRTFDWEHACEARTFGRPVILAGGLHPDNVADAIRRVRPYGVDVSSGVETTPGRKNPERIRALIREVRGVDNP
jgi:phosphoribosylanthranilate isomerase